MMNHKQCAARDKELIKAIEKYNGNLSRAAVDFGITRERARQIAEKFGVTGTGNQYSLKELDKIKKYYLKNYETKLMHEIEDHLGICADTLLKIRVKLNLPSSSKSASTKRAIYTADKMIKAWKKCDGHYSNMADYLGCHRPSVFRIMKELGLKEDYPALGRPDMRR